MFNYVKEDVFQEEISHLNAERERVEFWLIQLAEKLGYEIEEEKTKTIPAHWKKIKK